MRGAPHLEAGAELARRHQHVDVVGAHKVLRQADDGGRQGLLAMVVRRVLGHVACQLGDLRPAIKQGGKRGEGESGRGGACKGSLDTHPTVHHCHCNNCRDAWTAACGTTGLVPRAGLASGPRVQDAQRLPWGQAHATAMDLGPVLSRTKQVALWPNPGQGSSAVRQAPLRLPHLDILGEVALEGCKHDLALAGLQAVHHGGDRALQVRT